MSERILTNPYRDEFRYGFYPFVSAPTTSGGLVLPKDLVLDASLYPAGNFGPLRLRSAVSSEEEFTFTIGDANTESIVSGSVLFSDPNEIVRLTDAAGRSAGMLVLDTTRVAELRSWPLTSHSFGLESALIAVSCCIPMPGQGVRSIKVDDAVYTGDVWLVGEDGVVVREVEPGVIRIDVVGDPLFARRLCRPFELFQAPRVLQTINGIGPDANGEFQLIVRSVTTGDTALRIGPLSPGVLGIGVAGRPLSGG